jgi:hypothetical protein
MNKIENLIKGINSLVSQVEKLSEIADQWNNEIANKETKALLEFCYSIKEKCQSNLIDNIDEIEDDLMKAQLKCRSLSKMIPSIEDGLCEIFLWVLQQDATLGKDFKAHNEDMTYDLSDVFAKLQQSELLPIPEIRMLTKKKVLEYMKRKSDQNS